MRRLDSTIQSIASLEMLFLLIFIDDSYKGVTLEQF